MPLFANEVKNFCEKHTLLCVATLGLAIPVYCMGRLFGCITKPTGTTKKVNRVATQFPAQPKVSNQPLPQVSPTPNSTTSLQPSKPVSRPIFDELKARNKEKFKSDLAEIAKKIDDYQIEWEANQKLDRNSRFEKKLKEYENNDSLKKEDPAFIRQLAEKQADYELGLVESKHRMFLEMTSALLSSACRNIYLTKEEKDELLQPFLVKYRPFIKDPETINK